MADPQLVLVFEGVEERADLSVVARALGLEVLVEFEDAFEPDEDVAILSPQPRDPYVRSCLHALCVDQRSLNRILIAWRAWRRNGQAGSGLAELSKLFEHLKDVRQWGPIDRLRAVDWEEYLRHRITGQSHLVEVELWYRRSAELRLGAVQIVSNLIVSGGGEVITFVDDPETGYLAVKCTVPDESLRQLASGSLDAVQVVKSSHVLYVKVEGQGLLASVEDQSISDFEAALPTGMPRVAVLDGVPASNHPRLAGRVQILDPDDLASATESTVELRRHGTWMTSAVVWGDIAAGEAPLEGPVIVRPVLLPSIDTVDQVEEFHPDVLVPDLMRKAFADLFGGDDTGLTIVNISLGDPTVPFDTLMSSWARTLDALSWHYGVLIVVSAGNVSRLHLADHDSRSLIALVGADRSAAIHAAQLQTWTDRRILSPAESINAVTVGALHADASNTGPYGYVFDPHDGRLDVSPISRLGGGHRRAIKPEVAAPGGRSMFVNPPLNQTFVEAARSSVHGIRVATPTGGEGQIVGTSPAAALVSRKLARLVDLAVEVSGEDLDRHHRAVAAKAMLVHGARHPADVFGPDFPAEAAIGYGAISRDLADGCAPNEATLLFVGDLRHRQQQDLNIPLPDGLSTRDIKRITATVAWLSPVNWRHRQYRRAQMQLTKPTGFSAIPSSLDVSDAEASRGSSTVKHQVWELDRAIAAGIGSSLSARVKFFGQAGGMPDEPVPYAVVLSLWVAPEAGVDVYTQVAEQIRPRIIINPAGSNIS
ncbi:S8 family peptidase [Okibacterium fritillariae]|uniref:S8 family peptidase n=1 Tax=Okibacterium fritillariae TaxID=123320 RepID=UPI0013566DBC|nr:S8 family peptidase [Okibacterium fritillariae]